MSVINLRREPQIGDETHEAELFLAPNDPEYSYSIHSIDGRRGTFDWNWLAYMDDPPSGEGRSDTLEQAYQDIERGIKQYILLNQISLFDLATMYIDMH